MRGAGYLFSGRSAEQGSDAESLLPWHLSQYAITGKGSMRVLSAPGVVFHVKQQGPPATLEHPRKRTRIRCPAQKPGGSDERVIDLAQCLLLQRFHVKHTVLAKRKSAGPMSRRIAMPPAPFPASCRVLCGKKAVPCAGERLFHVKRALPVPGTR